MIKTWWHHLSDREKNIVGLGGALVLIFLVYVLIWSPLSNAVDSKRQAIVSQKQLLHWMQGAKSRIQRYRNAGIDITQTQTKLLLSLTETSLSQQHLTQYIQSVQQPQSHTLALTFKAVPFDPFIHWTQTLWHHHAIAVKSIDVMKTKIPGLVDIDIVLNQ